MTFNQNVPVASQSPGLFPPQNSTNFRVLKNIINRDHIFNDTPAAGDNSGTHRQVTMTARAAPTSPPGLPTGTNSILYSFLDPFNRTQLRFYNGTTDIPLTPPEELYPFRVAGVASITPHATAVAYPDPGFKWAGTGWGIIQDTNVSSFYNILRSGANYLNALASNQGGPSRPSLEFSGNNLLIRNNDSSTRVCVWSLIINRNI